MWASRNKEMMPPTQGGPPTKDEILSTLDSFGDKTVQEKENNNNQQLSRPQSDSSFDDWEKPDPPNASFSNSYSFEWEKLFKRKNYRKELRSYAMNGHLRSSRFRSVCWRVFLDVLPEDIKQWKNSCKKSRSKYTDLKDQLIVNPRKAVDSSSSDLVVNNPLSQADESPWNQFFLDNELRLTIKQDVIRTFPEVEFFHKDDVQEMMVDLLFCFCKTNTDLSYKQGMHELLAPLIFVLHCDHQAFLHAAEVETLGQINAPDRDIVKEVMDPAYLEHDAYALLSQIMRTVEPWYNSKDLPVSRGRERVNSIPFARPKDLNSSSAIVTKLTRIQDYILKKFDHELHGHLERLEIAPQIYGIRWIRLLFGREFPMQDLLALWDAIFADGVGFELVDFVFVAMLLYIRDLLLASDYPQCLNCLMRYPPLADINHLIDNAQYLREPKHHPRPPTYTYNTVNNAKSPVTQKPPPKTSSTPTSTSTNKHQRSGSLTSSFSEFSRKMRPKTLQMDGNKPSIYKSSSVPMNLQTDISPGTPQYPQHKRGSSASLSQVEDSMFKQTPSPSSMARLETANDRIVNTTAYSSDESPLNGNVARFSTLPNMKAKGKKISKQVAEFEHRIGELQGQINEKESMSLYCANKLDVHIGRLQTEILKQSLENEDEILLAIAGIKQVRDVLKGTLRFSQMEEEDLKVRDNYYETENNSSPETTQQESRERQRTGSNTKRFFYMSSEENSENAESPSEAPIPAVTSRKGSIRKEAQITKEDRREFELSDCVPTGGRKTGASGIQSVDVTEKTHPLENSPNPLYNYSCSVDSV
ncbi:TBC1 domain family member 5-like isoform X1 [Saccostrea echinata]|uniref:TBC1 domain family member 5-like isoform X1 n=1 Tax=Saccostrea echinata TaxID=191078 RepID=UPI002A810A56|nr:TBC1 domain family member 5-like isoform X1 [Saccostrea echinata]